MGLLAFLFVVAALNLCLGYALAARLGHGPPSLRAAWEALAGPARAYAASPAAPAPVEPPADFAQSFAADCVEETFEEDLSEQLDAQLDIQPYDESISAGDAAALAADTPENWDVNEQYVETAILKLNVAMIRSGIRATELDARLRGCRGNSDLQTIQRSLAELKEDCESYLAEQAEAAEKFHARVGELGELKALGEEIEMANLQQAAQIETTLNNLAYMDLQSNLEAANARLLEELKNLRLARHALRDSQEAAFLVVARYENRLDKIEKRLFNDPLTKLRNRIGLETTLWQWWHEGRQRSRQMSAALVDLDAFGTINELHGPLLGDRILFHVAQLIQALLNPADLAARYAGQRFLVVLADVGPRAATKTAEIIRQTVGRTTFRHGGEEIRVTAGIGIAEILPDDTPETVFQRLEATVATAKKSGPNRAFLHNGRAPEPVESPSFGAKSTEISI